MAANRAAGFESLSPDEVCDYLKEQIPSISENILEKIREHKIDGEVFLALNDEYLQEVAPLLGDRLKIKRTVTAALTRTSTVSFRLYFAAYIPIHSLLIMYCYPTHSLFLTPVLCPHLLHSSHAPR